MRAAVIVAALVVGIAAPAIAQPEPRRTVAWYAAHPRERDAVRRVCLNDPGHLDRHPDCVNAARGDLQAVLNDARRRNPAPVGMVAYWASRPADRAFKLQLCGTMSPAQQARSEGCVTARQSLAREQLMASRR